jgi:hypothetical protein
MIRKVVIGIGVIGMLVAGTSAAAASPVVVRDVPGTIELAGVGCETASTCIAVGAGPTVPTDGTVVTVTNGVPGAATAVAATGSLLAVTCWSATRCVAVGPSSGAAGVVLPITNGVPGTAVPIPASSLLLGVACLPSPSTTCYAVGTNASGTKGIVLAIKNGVPGATTLVPGSFELDMIDCPTTTTCFAAGGTASRRGVLVTLDNGKPSGMSDVPSAYELGGIGCTSADTCYAVGGKYNDTTSEVITVSNGTATTIRGFAGGTLAHIVCIFGGKCLASGYTSSGPPSGLEATISNGKPGKPVIVSGSQNLLRGACQSSDMCEVGGQVMSPMIGLIADSPV